MVANSRSEMRIWSGSFGLIWSWKKKSNEKAALPPEESPLRRSARFRQYDLDSENKPTKPGAGHQSNGFCKTLDMHSDNYADHLDSRLPPAHHGMRYRRQHGGLQHPRFSPPAPLCIPGSWADRDLARGGSGGSQGVSIRP